MIWNVIDIGADGNSDPGANAGYRLVHGDHQFACLIGKTGMILQKREGDQASPIGRWTMRALYYRPDRLARPHTNLPIHAIIPDLGWCDDPDDPAYNQPVTLPYAARHETMWRADHLYDLVITLGYNDDPPVPMAGSAIFLHLRESTTTHTAGCVALNLADFLIVAAAADTQTAIQIG